MPRPYVFEPPDRTRLRLEFVTPIFIRFEGEVSPEAPSFAAVVQNLLIRIPVLSAIHCGEVWQQDFKALVARAVFGLGPLRRA